MNNFESAKPIWLDLAYADYHPKFAPGLDVIGGKMEVPFYRAGGNEMIWNASLTPEGGAVKYAPDLGDFKPFGSAAGFWVSERESDEDAGLFGAQAGLRWNLLKDRGLFVTAGAGYFDYTSAEGKAVFDYTGATGATACAYGNSMTPNGKYKYDYNEAQVFVEAGVNVPVGKRKIPAAAYYDAVRNTASAVHQNDSEGWLVGASLGRREKPGDLVVKYEYTEVEKDALLGAFGESAHWGGGTDGRGHRVGLEAQLLKNVWLCANYYQDKRATDQDNSEYVRDKDYRRLRLDINFKF